MSKEEAFAEDNSNVAYKNCFNFDRADNIVGKEENACYQHFLPFPQYFS